VSDHHNSLRTGLLGIHSLNAFSAYNSSSRAVMFSSHFSQRLVIDGADEKRIQTGVEHDLSQYTFNIKMPTDGRIIKIIDRYPPGADSESLTFNPEIIVIYEDEKTKEIDYFSIPYFASYHQFFGFKYVISENINLLKPGAYIPGGTIFADSSSVSKNGGFKYGINANVAFMSIPSVSEDGVMVNRDFLKKLRFKVYETRVIEFGSGKFPLNLYGSKNNYKPFPDIGENIRDDGILMMLRAYENDLMPVEMSIYDAMEPDFIFDKAIYVRGGNGRVVDIKVTSNNNASKQLPELMSGQIEKYRKAMVKFYHEIINTEENLRYERKRKYGNGKVNFSPKLHRLFIEGLANINHNENKYRQSLNLLYRKSPIDEYRIEFTIEYVIEPNIGFKLTDVAGGK